MAATKIIVIHNQLHFSIDYITDPNKTAELNSAICYTQDGDKTEKGLYISSFNCSKNRAYLDMMATKRQFDKTETKVTGYHIIQAFQKGEVTPELAHKIGCELVQSCLAKRYEVIVTTHLNKDHLHNHILFNSVSMINGAMYRNNLKDYFRDIRGLSDNLCKQYALSVIEPKGKVKQYALQMAINRGEQTSYDLLRTYVDSAIKASLTFSEFKRNMQEMNFELKYGKHIAIRAKGNERYTRLKTLGVNYSEESIKQRILAQTKRELPNYYAPPVVRHVKVYGDFKLGKVTWKGLRALYYFYIRKLHKAQHPTSRREAAFLLREDLRFLDEFAKQSKFLFTHKFDTAEQVQGYIAELKPQIDELCAERKKLYRVQDKVGITTLNKKIRALRGDVKNCEGILERSVYITEKNAQLQNLKKEEKTHEPIRRSGRTNR